MSKAVKALLLSALVFPGAGHLLLKKYTSAIALATVAFIALYVLISNAIDRAMDIVDKVQSGEVQPDMAVITALVEKQTTGSEAQLINMATAILIISWLLGMIDAYRIGRTLDKEAAKIRQQKT